MQYKIETRACKTSRYQLDDHVHIDNSKKWRAKNTWILGRVRTAFTCLGIDDKFEYGDVRHG